MKKLLSLVMFLAVIMSAFVISTSAAEIYMQDDFSGEENNPENWITELGTKFFVEDGMLQGYKDAVVHQSAYSNPDEGREFGKNRDWTTFAVEMKFRIVENDSPGSNQELGFWIRAYGDDFCETIGQVYTLGYDHTNKAYVIGRDSLSATSDLNIVSVPAQEWQEGADAPWHTLGIKVEASGMISLYADGVKVLEANTADTSVTGSTEEFSVMGIHDTPLLLLNGNNYVQMDDIVVASPDYFSEGNTPAPGGDDTNPPAGDDTNNGGNDVNNGGNTGNTGNNGGNNGGNTGSNGNNGSGNTGNNGAGNSNPNATDTNKNQSGAASTGDALYIAVAVAVAAIGTAVIVKKVYSK